MKKKKSIDFLYIMRLIFFVVGVVIILYPLITKMYQYTKQTKQIQSFYSETINENEKKELLKEKEELEMEIKDGAFNTGEDAFLSSNQKSSEFPQEKPIGVISIPKINMTSSIYKGINDDTLAHSVGVLPKTNLPYGGENSNSVLVAHRGTHNAELFRRVDELENNDLILIYNKLSDSALAYRVTHIEIILPEEGNKIQMQEGKDLITLITCTPYLINSHRLIITAERDLDYIADNNIQTTNITIKNVLSTEYICFFGFLIILFILMVLLKLRPKKGGKNEEKTESN